MAKDAHVLPEHQAGCVQPWLATIGVTCEARTAADLLPDPSDVGPTWPLRPGDTLFTCRRGQAVVQMKGAMFPEYGRDHRIIAKLYVLDHLHLRRRFSGRTWTHFFHDGRLRADIRRVIRRNAEPV